MTAPRVFLLLTLGSLLLAACHHPRYAHRHHHAQAQVTVIYHQPPTLKVVVRPARPSVHHVWIGGRWAWKGRWIWVDGYYKRRPYAHAHWVSGHWKRQRGGWVWIPGHWRRG